jgi:hypothetical protein
LKSCSGDPYFKQVNSNILILDFDKNDDFDTLIISKEYLFLHVADYPNKGPMAWDATQYFFLQKSSKLFRLEPVKDISNGFLEVTPLNDSIICFYSQLSTRIFGDFWLIRKGNSNELFYNPGKISNNREYELKYENGRLIKVGNATVNIDSLKLTGLKDKLYRLDNDSLILVDKYENLDLGNKFSLNYNFGNLQDGFYYFSYPGRKIDYILNLKAIK